MLVKGAPCDKINLKQTIWSLGWGEYITRIEKNRDPQINNNNGRNGLVLMTLPLDPRWCHQMETFSTLLDLCAGISPGTSEFPSQKPAMQSFDVSFDSASE